MTIGTGWNDDVPHGADRFSAFTQKIREPSKCEPSGGGYVSV
jgi:hypothetical protein